MTSVKPGSVPQNWRASSRAAAVQRLCPIITRTVSPGRTYRGDGVVQGRHDRSRPATRRAGVTKLASRSADATRNSWSRVNFGPTQT